MKLPLRADSEFRGRSRAFTPLHAIRLLIGLAFLACMRLAGAADFHHVHLLATDTKAAADWYAKHMEGEYRKAGGGAYDAAVFGKIWIIFKKADAGFAGSEGSTLDHIGWSFKDLDAKMKEFEAAGIKILQPARPLGKIKFGFIMDPDGTKIEVMQDPDLIGFHHVHLHAPDPDAMIKWYAGFCGGEPTKYSGVLPAIKYGEMWLIVQKSPAEKAPTSGRAAEHLGWTVPDLEAARKTLAAQGISFTQEPSIVAGTGTAIAFFNAPGGVRTEILQLPPPK